MNNNFWISKEGCAGHQQNRDICYEGPSALGQKRSHQYVGNSSEAETVIFKKQTAPSYQNIPMMQKMCVPPIANASIPFSPSVQSDHRFQPQMLLSHPRLHPFSVGYGNNSGHGNSTFLEYCPFIKEISGGAWAASRQNLHTFSRIKNQNPIRVPGRKHPGIKFTLRGKEVEKRSPNWKITASEFDEDGEGFFSVGPPQTVNTSAGPEKHEIKSEICRSKTIELLPKCQSVGFCDKDAEADTRLTLSCTYEKNNSKNENAEIAYQNFTIINSSDFHVPNSTLINNDSSKEAQKVANQEEFRSSSSTKSMQTTDHQNPASSSKINSNAVTSKDSKPKISTSPFPVNVKSLLLTGIFDGIDVKYVSWDRKKSIRGTINGAGYLCHCNDCNATKIVNAFELEMHAGCKSKHPNNHIYFSNGKNIYSVVQELRSISSDQLPEAIRTITGYSVHETNFSIWKASFRAATQEKRATLRA